MAITKKNKKIKSTDASKLNPDIEERIEVKKILNDERSHKIAGTLLMLIAFLLLISFTSYLFTWQEDQSKVFKGAKILLPDHAEPMANLLGTAGAYFSDLFFRSGFGIASYLFCTFFFIAGVNLFSPKKIFSIGRNIRYVIVGLLVISVSASFLMSGHPFPFGGAAGDMASKWLQQVIGKVGTASLLLAAMFSYIIWRFNPSFSFQNKKLPHANEMSIDQNDEPFATAKSFDPGAQGSLHTDFLPLTTNPIKDDNGLNHDIQIFEKSERASFVEEHTKGNLQKEDEKNGGPTVAQDAANSIRLEVKTAPDTIKEGPNTNVIIKPKQQQPYDPILDLRNYKFPNLDLLEAHGSEKIIHVINNMPDHFMNLV
jgi:S-DNA-T family DNA segregation ATPase FtsK/SpoIIIE